MMLLVHMRLAGHVASIAGATALSTDDSRGLRIQLVGDASGALVVLLINTVCRSTSRAASLDVGSGHGTSEAPRRAEAAPFRVPRADDVA